jgi:hypothetical protein
MLRSAKTPMTKELLLNGLNNILNNFLFGMVSTRIIPTQSWKEASTSAVLFKGPEDEAIQVALRPLAKRLIDPTLRDGCIRNIETSLIRSLVRESYELIMLHCEETKQFPIFKAESWFQFTRILRNVASHKQGGVLREWPHDLTKQGITSVVWRHRTLDTAMVGTEISFYPYEALRLAKDLGDFVTAKLS